jgi:hypothetical protein
MVSDHLQHTTTLHHLSCIQIHAIVILHLHKSLIRSQNLVSNQNPYKCDAHQVLQFNCWAINTKGTNGVLDDN